MVVEWAASASQKRMTDERTRAEFYINNASTAVRRHSPSPNGIKRGLIRVRHCFAAMVSKSGCRTLCLAVFGLAFVALGLFMVLHMIPILIDHGIQKAVVIRESREPEPEYRVSQQVWFFNVTNAKDVMLTGQRPRFQEVGPYGYRIRFHKTNMSFSDDASRVFFYKYRQFHFSPEFSCPKCSENDIMTVPNVLLMTVMKKVQGIPFVSGSVSSAINRLRATPFVSRPVGKLLFKGYKDVFLDLLSSFGLGDFPDKVGYFYKLNNSHDGFYEADTGLNDTRRVGEVIQWNGEELLPAAWWSSVPARMLNGSGGDRYRPFLTSHYAPRTFMADLCRSFKFVFKEELDFQGFHGLEFEMPGEVVDWSRPENQGFCTAGNPPLFPEQSPYCLPNGLLDLGQCKPGNPASILSFPHYLHSSPFVHEFFHDIQRPNQSRDGSSITLEQTTGAPLKISLKFQINVPLIHDKYTLVLSKLRPQLVPVLWMNQTAVMTEPTRAAFYHRLIRIPKFAYWGSWVGVGVGALLLLLAGFFCIVAGTKKKRYAQYQLGRPKQKLSNGVV